MGSAALDASGNLAIGYSASSPTLYPSVWYAARLRDDPAGQLRQHAHEPDRECRLS